MNKSDLSQSNLLVNRALIKHYDLKIAVFLADLINKEHDLSIKNQLAKNGEFHYPGIDRKQSIGISFYQQSKIVKRLCRDGVISVIYKGLPSKQYIKIHHKKLVQLLMKRQAT